MAYRFQKENDPDVKDEIILDNKPTNITFATGEKWVVKFTNEGQIKFNRENYPDSTPDDFAQAFMEIIERTMEVKFDKTKRFEYKNFTLKENES